MRKKFLLAFLAIVGLGSFVVFGSSPQFVSGMIVSMENSPITTFFSSANPSERSETSYPQPLGPEQEPSVAEIPQNVLWQMVFIFSKNAETEAEKANGSSDEAMLWRNYFTRQGRLSVQNDSALKETASKFLEEIEPLDQKAKEIIEKSRAKYRDAKSVNREDVLPPNELGDLQQRRDETTLRYRDSFRNAIGEGSFQAFSTFLAEDFSRGAKQSSFPDKSGGSDSLSPQVWVGFTWIIWNDNPIIPLVTGLAGTYFDYYTGYYYDPWVGSILYNWTTDADIHTGTDKGFAWLYPALTFHPVYPTVRGNWYCIYSEHWAIDGLIPRPENGTNNELPIGRTKRDGTSVVTPANEYYLGYTEPCHLVPQCQGFSPNDICPNPSPTPTPSPTPIEVKTVGFAGDFQVLKFSGFSLGTTGPPITDPTWTRGSAANTQNVVAYTKGTETTKMKLSATFDVNPAPPAGDGFNAKVRVKYNGNIIATTSSSTPVTQSTFNIPDLQVTSALESTPQVKKGNYTFDWEVSVDDGQTWRPAGNSEHIIYWTFADPINPPNCSGDVIPRNCTFANASSNLEFYQFPGLYDLALATAIDSLSSETQTKEAIAKSLAALVDAQAIYDPNEIRPNLDHPLRILTEYHKAQCSGNTALLQGLLRSIGIDSNQIFIWGGKPITPPNLEDGGKVYFYNYKRATPDPGGDKKTFQVKRPAKLSGGENVEKDPHFSFHAMVELDGKYYDPSYGFNLYGQTGYPFSNVVLEEVADLDNPNNPRPFKLGYTATLPFTVKALNLLKYSCMENCGDYAPVTTPKYCSHSFKIAKGQVRADFDNDNRDDLSVFRPSEGKWYIKRSSDQSFVETSFGAIGDKIVPADYDGDGITDFAVWRPSNATWYILKSSGSYETTQFGVAGDKPVYGDFDGDGKSDIAVYRPSNATWYFLYSSGSFVAVNFGTSEDVPVTGDYDGDGKTDIAVFRPSTGTWYFLTSGGSYYSSQFGTSEDIPLSGDFDNDDKTDLVVFRPSNSTWYIQGADSFSTFQFGESGDIPAVGSFDDDGIPDPTVWSPSSGRWKVLLSETNTIFETYWGINGDLPIPSAYNR